MMQKRKRRPLSKKEKALYAGILAGFSIFYFGYYLPYVLSQLPPSNQLAKFDFPENEWFEAEDVTITNNARFFQLPITNDELTYKINYKNKVVGNLSIFPELEIVYGGKTVQKVVTNLITVSQNESYEQKIVFYSNNTGLNQIRLNVRIVNAINYSLLDTVSETFNIRLHSQSDVFQSQLNEITNVGIFVSVGVATFTIYTSYVSSRLSKRQLESDLDEKEKTLRPWIGVEGLTLDKTQDYCRLHYHNYGRLPATSAKYKFKVSASPISFQDVQAEDYDSLVSNNIIFPNFDHTTLIRIDKAIADAARKGADQLFLGVIIEYQYGNEKLGKYGGIFEYESEHDQFRIVGQQID